MRRRLGPDDLVLTNCSSGCAPLPEMIDLAAANGFAGLSLWPTVLTEAVDAGHDPAGLKRRLDDAGLVCNDVDAAIVWVGRDELPATVPGGGGQPVDLLFEVAATLDADLCNVAIVGDGGYSEAAAVDAFGRIAERIVAAGLVPHLEFLPISPVADVGTALRIVEASGVESAGVMIDAWHVQRGPTTLDDLAAVDAERVLGIQLCDAPASPAADLRHETLHERLLPGEGDGDVVGLLRTLDGLGHRAPITIEVYSDALNELGPTEATRRAGQTLRAVLGAARS
ncbi:MAG: sugar phosphate isomerase/epimerase [Actinomycetota bacterium]